MTAVSVILTVLIPFFGGHNPLLDCGSDLLVLEAESASETVAPASIVETAGASGGKSVQLSDAHSTDIGNASLLSPSRSPGAFTCRQEIPASGRYKVWVRLQWHCICARLVEVSCSSQELLKSDSLSSSAVPRRWHWVVLGEGMLERGPVEIAFVERGHQALIDCLVFSRDLDWEPPSFSKKGQTLQLSFEQLNWQDKGEHRSCAVGDTAFGDCVISMAVKTPPELAVEKPFWWLCFSEGADLQYQVSLQKSSAESLEVRILSCAKGKTPTIVGQGAVKADQLWQAVEVKKVGANCEVSVGGLVAATSQCSSSAPCTIGMFCSKTVDRPVDEVRLRAVEAHVAPLPSAESGWTTICGSWLADSGEQAEEFGAAVLGRSKEAPGVCLAPWPAGEEFSLFADVRALEGSAGVVIDATDCMNYCAVLVDSQRDAAERLSVVSCKRGEISVKKTLPLPILSDQWVRLYLQRQGERLSIATTAGSAAIVDQLEWRADGRMGLYTGPASAGLFGRIEFNDHACLQPLRMTFGSGQDLWWLAHWNQIQGRFAFRGHPGQLVMLNSGDGKPPSIELRRPLPIGSKVVVTIDESSPRRTMWPGRQPEQGGNDHCGLCIRLAYSANRVYDAKIFSSNPQEVQLLVNGEPGVEVAQDVKPQARELKLYLEVNASDVEAGLVGGQSARLPIEAIPCGATARLSLLGLAIQDQEELSISEIDIAADDQHAVIWKQAN